MKPVHWLGLLCACSAPAEDPAQSTTSVALAFGGDREVFEPTFGTPTSSTATRPAIAFAGNHLVAWEDTRGVDAGKRAIYVSRVTVDGTVLDAGGIYVGLARSSRALPQVATDGTDFLVTWLDQDILCAARVTADGTVVDTSRLELATGLDPTKSVVAAAGNADGYVVAWNKLYDAHVLHVGLDGAVVDRGDINTLALAISTIRVVWVETEAHYVVSYVQPDSDAFVTARWLDTQGVATGKFSSVHTPFQQRFAVTSNGSDAFYAWTSTQNAAQGTWIATGGTFGNATRDIAAGAITITAAETSAEDFLVVWERLTTHELGARRYVFGNDVTAVNLNPFVVTAAQRFDPVASYGGSAKVLVASASAVAMPASGAIEGTIITGTLVGSSQTISTVAEDLHNGLVVGAPGSAWLALAISGRDSSLSTTMLATDGSALGTPPAVLGPADYASAAPTSQGYGVVWMRSEGGTPTIHYARVDGFGAASGAATLYAHGGVAAAGIVHGDGASLVVWQQPSASTGLDLYAMRVADDGAVLDATPFPIVEAAGTQSQLGVAFDGTQWIAFWVDDRDATKHQLYGARISGQGAVSDVGSVLPATVKFAGTYTLTANASYLAWQVKADGTNPNHDYFRGSALDTSSGITLAATADTAPIVDADVDPEHRNLYGLQLADDGRGVFALYMKQTAAGDTIGAARRISLDGTSNTVVTLPADLRLQDLHGYAMWTDGEGKTMLATTRYVRDHRGADRMFVRVLDELGDGATCEASTQCASGFCIDGTCCPTSAPCAATPDGGTGGPDGVGADGGNGDTDDGSGGGGCCQAEGGSSNGALVGLLVAGVVLKRRRRR